MHLHSTLNGRAGGFRLRGAAWEVNSLSFRGFLYLVPSRDAGDGRHQVVDAEGKSMWKLLESARRAGNFDRRRARRTAGCARGRGEAVGGQQPARERSEGSPAGIPVPLRRVLPGAPVLG